MHVYLFEQRSRVIPYAEKVFASLQQRSIRIGRYVCVHVVVSEPRCRVFRCLRQGWFGLYD